MLLKNLGAVKKYILQLEISGVVRTGVVWSVAVTSGDVAGRKGAAAAVAGRVIRNNCLYSIVILQAKQNHTHCEENPCHALQSEVIPPVQGQHCGTCGGLRSLSVPHETKTKEEGCRVYV